MKFAIVANLMLKELFVKSSPRVTAIIKSLKETCDENTILIVLGNVGVNSTSIKAAQTALGQLPCTHKLYVAGRHDICNLSKKTLNYEIALQKELNTYGFHLLDYAPYAISQHVFVGNTGWYNGSLWTIPSGQWPKVPAWPRLREPAQKGWEDWFATNLENSQHSLTSQGFFHRCQSRLKTHLDSMMPALRDGGQLVICTESMPSVDLLPIKYTPEEHYNRYAAGWIPQASLVNTLTPIKTRTIWYSGYNQSYTTSKINLRTTSHNNNYHYNQHQSPDPNGIKVENVGSTKPLIVNIDEPTTVTLSKPSVM